MFSPEGNFKSIEKELANDRIDRIEDRIAGFHCRQIVELAIRRWGDIGPLDRKAMEAGTKDAIERAGHLVKWVHRYGGEKVVYREGEKSRAVRMSHRLWYYQELCLIISELRIRYLLPHAALHEVYRMDELSWQVCWEGSRDMKSMMRKIWAPFTHSRDSEKGSQFDQALDSEDSDWSSSAGSDW